MPTYDFKDTTTGEVFTRIMKIADREQYLQDNPHIETVLTSPNFIDPVRLGVRKVDNGFKEVLQRVHEKTPGSALNRTTNI
jgi:hypothetical protein